MSVVLRSIKDGWLLLTEKGSRFKMILASALLALAFILPMMLGVYLPMSMPSVISELPETVNEILKSMGMADMAIEVTENTVSDIQTSMAYDLTVFFGAFITLPAYAFFFTYAWQTYSKTRYGFVDRERPKKGCYNYFRSLFAGFALLFRPLICFIMLQIGYYAARVISEGSVSDGVAIPMIVLLIPFWAVALFLSALLLWLTNSRFLAPYYYGRGMSIRKANKLSKEKCARHPFLCDGFSLIFGAAAALSLISVGVLFILLVLPLMMFTYFSLAEHMDGKKLLED